jgi:hypothetical protein
MELMLPTRIGELAAFAVAVRLLERAEVAAALADALDVFADDFDALAELPYAVAAAATATAMIVTTSLRPRCRIA